MNEWVTEKVNGCEREEDQVSGRGKVSGRERGELEREWERDQGVSGYREGWKRGG